MSETTDDIRPLGAGGRLSPVALARVAAKVIGIITPAVVAAVVSYRTAAGDAEIRTQVVKNKSEAGYQVTKEAMQAQDKRIADLEASVRQLLGQQHPAARRGSRPRPITPPAPIPAKALPNDLDKAEKQVYKGAAAATVQPARDGSTVNHER